MRCRRATPEDAAELAQLRWRWRIDEDTHSQSQESHDAFLERFIAFAHAGLADRWTAWVAELDGRIVSTIWIYRVPKVPSPGRAARDFGYVTNVYTVPDMRDGGVGSELLAAVTTWAHESDLEMLIVWPSERSTPWYSRAGFLPSADMLELEVGGYEG